MASSTSSMKASHIIAVLNICKRGDAVFLKKLLTSNCNFDEVKDRKGRNALHYCAELDSALSEQAKPGGRLACARILLESDLGLENKADFDGFLPFHHAVIHGNIPLVQLFLSFGVDVNCLVDGGGDSSTVAVSGRTALHLAVIYANYEMLEFLLTGSFTTQSGEKMIFKVDVHLMDAQSATTLHYAVQLPEAIAASIIKCIVNKSDIDIDALDAHKRTPLIWAATIGAASAASMLIELGADLSMVEESGLTALHCAASRGHNSTVQAILNNLGLRKEKRDLVLNARDADGCTPLFYSVTMGHKMITKKLLEAGADASATDIRGRGLFHCASRSMVSGGSGTIDLLIEHGADPCDTNAVGDTALHEACVQVSKDCVAKLLKLDQYRQETINLKNSAKQTSLQIATQIALKTSERTSVSAMAVDICVLLCQAGAEINANESITDDNSSPIAMVRSCLHATPNYRPALELEQLFTNYTSPQTDIKSSTQSEITTRIITEMDDSIISERLISDKEESQIDDEEDIESTKSFREEFEILISKTIQDGVQDIIDEHISKSVSEEATLSETPPVRVSVAAPFAVSTARTGTASSKNSSIKSNLSKISQIVPSSKHSSQRSHCSIENEQHSSNLSQASETLRAAPVATNAEFEIVKHSLTESDPSIERSSTRIPTIPSVNTEGSTQSQQAKNIINKVPVTTRVNSSPSLSTSSSARSRATMISAYTQTVIYHNMNIIPRKVSPINNKFRNFSHGAETSLHSSYKISPAHPRKHPRNIGGYKPPSDVYQKNSCGIYESPITGRQRMPPPTVSPYLNPVAKWPREMASMMLAGKVSPLYAQRVLNQGCVSSWKQTPLESKRSHPVRARSAAEARFHLNIAEKEFAKLAERVLDRYDTMVLERQRLHQAKKRQILLDY